MTMDAREAALVGLRQMLWAVENGAELAHVEVVRDVCGTHAVSVRLARQKTRTRSHATGRPVLMLRTFTTKRGTMTFESVGEAEEELGLTVPLRGFSTGNSFALSAGAPYQPEPEGPEDL